MNLDSYLIQTCHCKHEGTEAKSLSGLVSPIHRGNLQRLETIL